MIPRDAPFVLLDNASAGNGPARLYASPSEVIEARTAGEVRPALERLRVATAAGGHAAGFLAYEAGYALEPKLAPLAKNGALLLWFGLFDGFDEVDAATLLPDAAGGWCGTPVPQIKRADYEAALARVLALIAAGDIYQANLTFAATVATGRHPLALYAGLRERAKAPWGGMVFTGKDWLLSLSPELFFALDGGALIARPMKGTAARTSDDRAAVAALRDDPKQRAENLMIVDLLRNDLSKVAAPGSVVVPELFAVETYPTVHQMTSTVTARLAEGRDAIDVMAAMFPCGSVTGAPKVRAMEVIAEAEAGPREPYTGSIGRFAPGDSAAFNVAIRTLHLREGESGARLGLGSGVVADSRAADEWRECVEKGRFVASGQRFDLIETMAFDPREGVVRIDRHLARMGTSADTFGFVFDRHEARNELQAATFRLRAPARVRLRLGSSGRMAIETRAFLEPPAEPVEVAIAPLPVDPGDFRLRHKTSDRDFYDEARVLSGAFEALFADPDGYLTEGSFTSIFVERDGRLLTPPLARGLLPGVLRAELIDDGRAVEADLTPADLADGFLIGNSLRGLIRARPVAGAAPPR